MKLTVYKMKLIAQKGTKRTRKARKINKQINAVHSLALVSAHLAFIALGRTKLNDNAHIHNHMLTLNEFQVINRN